MSGVIGLLPCPSRIEDHPESQYQDIAVDGLWRRLPPTRRILLTPPPAPENIYRFSNRVEAVSSHGTWAEALASPHPIPGGRNILANQACNTFSSSQKMRLCGSITSGREEDADQWQPVFTIFRPSCAPPERR
jgi:hypothetical protein